MLVLGAQNASGDDGRVSHRFVDSTCFQGRRLGSLSDQMDYEIRGSVLLPAGHFINNINEAHVSGRT